MIMEEMIKSTSSILFLITIYAFSKTHVMNNLIIIELTTVTIIMMMFIAMTSMKMENYMILFFTILAICESMVGLSLMIAMIRTHSNDFMKSLSILKF